MHHTKLPITYKNFAIWTVMPSPMLQVPLPSSSNSLPTNNASLCRASKVLDSSIKRGTRLLCEARRRVRDEDRDDEYGHNEDIAKLEFYSLTARGEALLVHALVDQEEVDVLIFKGFSSCLSYSTSPDPTRSVLPARAVIKTIDRIKGPFDPANIEYLHKDVTWEEFKTNVLSN